MAKPPETVWLAIVMSALSCPGLCGGSVGMMLAEGSDRNGGITQQAHFFPLGLAYGVAAIVSAVLCGVLVTALVRRQWSSRHAWAMRVIGLSPICGGLAFIVAGFMRVRDVGSLDGALGMLLGAGLIALGIVLVRTKLPPAPPTSTTPVNPEKIESG